MDETKMNKDENKNYYLTQYGFVTKKPLHDSNVSISKETKQNNINNLEYYTEYGFITKKNEILNSNTQTFDEIIDDNSEEKITTEENDFSKNIVNKKTRKSNRKKYKSQPTWFGVIIIALVFGLFPSIYVAYKVANPSPVVLESHKYKKHELDTGIGESKASNWVEIAKAVQPSVVAIKIQIENSQLDGSGVVIDDKGHIVTNYHVISKALTTKAPIIVQLQGGVLYDAEIVGYDSSTDLAVIKLKNAPQDLVPATLGTSSTLQVGEPVVAVGNPLGLESTVTTGIISALDRPVRVSVGTPDQGDELVVTNAIQVDASINPGNSGGPLFDSSGKVIGINSSIATTPNQTMENTGSIGLGFAIPIDLVKNITEQIIKTGKAEHPLLGVTISNGEGTVKNERYIGAYVKTVVPNSPAEQIGIEPGDMIIDIDGNRVISDTSLRGYVRRYQKGDKAIITYLRNGKEMQKEVTFTITQ